MSSVGGGEPASTEPATAIDTTSTYEVCEHCSPLLEAQLQEVQQAAEEHAEELELRLAEFENEAMGELEAIQSELLDARASSEVLRQLLSEAEQKRLQEQQMKKALEMQLLRLSEEAMHQRQSPSSQASYIGEIRGLRIDGSPSARSSEGLAEPGTPDQQEAESPRPSAEARRMSYGEVSGEGMEELALALAQLREDFRRVTTELVTKKMELALSEEAMLRMVDKYEKHSHPQPATTSTRGRLSFWRS